MSDQIQNQQKSRDPQKAADLTSQFALGALLGSSMATPVGLTTTFIGVTGFLTGLTDASSGLTGGGILIGSAFIITGALCHKPPRATVEERPTATNLGFVFGLAAPLILGTALGLKASPESGPIKAAPEKIESKIESKIERFILGLRLFCTAQDKILLQKQLQQKDLARGLFHEKIGQLTLI